MPRDMLVCMFIRMLICLFLLPMGWPMPVSKGFHPDLRGRRAALQLQHRRDQLRNAAQPPELVCVAGQWNAAVEKVNTNYVLIVLQLCIQ